MANQNAPLLKSEERLRTPKGTLIYPWVFKEDKMSGKFSAILAVDPDTDAFKEFKKTVMEFGTEAFKKGKPEGLTWCIRSGDKWLASKKSKTPDKLAEVVKGKALIFMKSSFAPTVSVARNGGLDVIESKADEKLIYTGCTGAAQGVLAAFDGKYPSVVFWFSQVARLGAGEKLGGVNPTATFGDMYDPDDDSVGAGADEMDLDADLDDDIEF